MSSFFLLSLFACSSEINRDVQRKAPVANDFDILIFTQRWPITDCMTWMNKGKDHICILPSQKDTWIIHGIWPNKFGKFGPFFCNSSAIFDVNALQPIMDEMLQYWLNIEKGKASKAHSAFRKIESSLIRLNLYSNEIRYPRGVFVEARMVEARHLRCNATSIGYGE